MAEIPRLKKKIVDYLSEEDAKISKDKALIMGCAATSALAINALDVFASCDDHDNNTHSNSENCINYDDVTGKLEADHAHHADHSDHSSY